MAVTRAKAMLVVIGDPILLVRNRFWKELLSEAEKSEGYTGAHFTVEKPVPVRFAMRVELSQFRFSTFFFLTLVVQGLPPTVITVRVKVWLHKRTSL